MGIRYTPPGYAEDIATACTSKEKMDKAVDIVSKYGKKWQYDINNNKYAILMYDEDKKNII